MRAAVFIFLLCSCAILAFAGNFLLAAPLTAPMILGGIVLTIIKPASNSSSKTWR